MNKKLPTIIIIVLVLLLIVSVGYIVFDKYQAKIFQKEIGIYQQGIQAGQQQAASFIYQQATACKPVPLTFENKTINLVAVECLK